MTKQKESSEEFGGSRYFLNIPAGVAHDPDLQKFPKAILIFGEIWSMLNVTGDFYMSNSRMSHLYHCSKASVKRALTILEEKGLISRESVYAPGTRQVIHRRISTGPALGSYMNPPSVHERTPPGCTGEPTLGSQVSQIIEQSNRAINRTLNSPQAKPGNPKGEKQENNLLSDPKIKAIRSRDRENHDSIYMSYQKFLQEHPDGGSETDQARWKKSILAVYGWYGWDEERKRAIDQALAEGKSVEEIDSLSIPGMPDQ